MTGPAYPPGNLPGSDAIGYLAIGEGSVGNIRPFDVWRTVISQYANSPRLMALITNFQDAIDQTANFEQFFDLIWNVDTAVGYGLDVWGRIVAVNRVLHLGVGPPYFGFDEGYPDYEPYDTAPYYSGGKLTTNYMLSDDGFRILILAKAFSNICDGSMPAINRLLKMLFTPIRAYCTDGLDMTMTYTFESKLSAVQYAILTQSGVFPKPTGVSYTVVQL